ncbi:thioredoxin domain-containing protein [Pseudoalteromonas carrageenovora]|uniref:DsbA family protein n=1 Tax=Pseudoalteromonas carrageenovora TaxID=227 RepID=UPI00311F236F
MKKLLLLCFVVILSGCQSTQNNENEELKKELAQLKKVQRQVAIKVGLGELVRPEKIELSSEAIWIGSQDADVVMIEFTDLHCPYCKKFQQTVWPELKAKFVDTNKLAVSAREFPLSSLHPKAPYAAVTLRCANEQGQYENVKERLFELGQSVVKGSLDEIVKDFNLNQDQFDTCLANTDVHNIVTRSLQDAAELGLTSTPTFIIGKKEGNYITNYEILTGAGSIEKFGSVIEAVKTAK